MKAILCLVLITVACAPTITVKEQDRVLRCMKTCLGFQPVMENGKPASYCSAVICNNERFWNKCLDSCQ